LRTQSRRFFFIMSSPMVPTPPVPSDRCRVPWNAVSRTFPADLGSHSAPVRVRPTSGTPRRAGRVSRVRAATLCGAPVDEPFLRSAPAAEVPDTRRRRQRDRRPSPGPPRGSERVPRGTAKSPRCTCGADRSPAPRAVGPSLTRAGMHRMPRYRSGNRDATWLCRACARQRAPWARTAWARDGGFRGFCLWS